MGLREAFADRHKKGFSWNSLMQQKWADHLGQDHKVLDDYNRNKQLVDLFDQPDNIKEVILQTIIDACVPLNRPQIGLYFLKLCGKYDLQKLSEQPATITQILSAPYPKNGN